MLSASSSKKRIMGVTMYGMRPRQRSTESNCTAIGGGGLLDESNCLQTSHHVLRFGAPGTCAGAWLGSSLGRGIVPVFGASFGMFLLVFVFCLSFLAVFRLRIVTATSCTYLCRFRW